MKCPNCGNITQPDAVFCDQCGTRLPQEEAASAAQEQGEQTATPAPPAPASPTEPAAAGPAAPAAAPPPSAGAQCPACGAMNTPGEMFCSECGTPLEAPAPEAGPEAPQAAPEAPAMQAEAAPEAQAAQPAPSTAERTCPACGAQVPAGDSFCYVCGADLSAAGAPAEGAASEGETLAAETPAAEAAQTETTAPQAAVPPPAEVQPTGPAPALAPSELRECPACGAQVSPGDTFCEFCGAALVTPDVTPAATTPAPASASATAPASTPTAAPQPQSNARLVVESSGVEIPLPASSEVIVGREDPYTGVFPDVDLTPHGGEEGGVSRRHFKLTRSGDSYTIEDLNSTNFTMVNRTRVQPGQPVALSDGDEIRAGRVRLTLRTA